MIFLLLLIVCYSVNIIVYMVLFQIPLFEQDYTFTSFLFFLIHLSKARVLFKFQERNENELCAKRV